MSAQRSWCQRLYSGESQSRAESQPADALVTALGDGGAELRAALPDAARAQAIVARAEPPAEIAAAYEALGDDPPVAVRSSACAEDSETASYAGQQETYLYVRGADAVRDRVRDCWASFFSERAIFYRRQKGSLDDLEQRLGGPQDIEWALEDGELFVLQARPVTAR